jgi:hypothetical protein
VLALAYVFWHRPGDDIEPAAYEARLAAFHAALAGQPPDGFSASVALRVREAPWLPGAGAAYEDWYAVEDWASLGRLNAGAVSGERAEPHHAVAAEAAVGAGGVYGLVSGPPVLAARRTAWLAKPAGFDRGAFEADLAGPGRSVWRRQMVLGPAPEYAVRSDVPVVLPWEARAIEATAV